MTAYRKAKIRELTRSANDLDGHFLEGVLKWDEDRDQWMVGSTTLEEWLKRFRNEDITLILFSMKDDHPLNARVCRTCGREYTDLECPHCRDVRLRLRGR